MSDVQNTRRYKDRVRKSKEEKTSLGNSRRNICGKNNLRQGEEIERRKNEVGKLLTFINNLRIIKFNILL